MLFGEDTMEDKQAVIQHIRSAFANTPHPDDRFLQGSFEGREPFEEVQAFQAKLSWQGLTPQFLDSHYEALHFFSEGGLRFFLPAFLIADLNGDLQTADPLFTLIHGFAEEEVKITINERVFIRRTGRSALINPRRYGGITFYDYARMRLSVFTREESRAIVDYLRYKRHSVSMQNIAQKIDSALETFWLSRAHRAPSATDLQTHLQEQHEFMTALQNQDGDSD
jgi:hypothetical protein